MRFIFLLLVCIGITSIVSAQDDVKPKKTDTLGQAVARGYTRLRKESDDSVLVRTTIIPTHDSLGNDGVVFIGEFKQGIGLFLSARDAQNDQWIYIDKDHCDVLEEASHRVK